MGLIADAVKHFAAFLDDPLPIDGASCLTPQGMIYSLSMCCGHVYLQFLFPVLDLTHLTTDASL